MEDDYIQGTIVATNGTVTLALNGQGTTTIQGTGTFSGNAAFQASVDGVNYKAIYCMPLPTGTVSGGINGTGQDGLYACPTAGLSDMQVIGQSWVSGTATITMRASVGTTFTYPFVSNQGNFEAYSVQAGTWTMQPGNTANTTPWLSTINQGGNSAAVSASNALKVDGSAVTQPVSIAASVPVSFVSPLPVTQSGTWNVGITGSPTVSISPIPAASPLPVLITGPSPLPVNGNINVTNASIPVTESGTWTVQPGNTPNTSPWLESISAGGNTATVTASSALKVDGSAVTQPVSGSVSISGTPTVSISPIPTASPLPVLVTTNVSPINANSTLSSRQSVNGTESNLVSPSNTIGVLIECESGNSDNLRYGFSNSSSTILSTTLGLLCEPGRDSGFLPIGAGNYLHMIAVTTNSSDYIDVQWVKSQ